MGLHQNNSYIDGRIVDDRLHDLFLLFQLIII